LISVHSIFREGRMVFQNNGVTYTLRNEDIDYIESLGRKLIIHSKNEDKIPLSKYRYEDFAKEYSSYLERSR